MQIISMHFQSNWVAYSNDFQPKHLALISLEEAIDTFPAEKKNHQELHYTYPLVIKWSRVALEKINHDDLIYCNVVEWHYGV